MSQMINFICDPLVGPFVSEELGDFDPIRDLEVYIAGVRVGIASAYFDPSTNKYQIYVDREFDELKEVVQVIHRMPNPPFCGVNRNLFNFSYGSDPDVTVGL